MTARVVGAASVEISMSTGDELEEVIRNYTKELGSKGHDVNGVQGMPIVLACRHCGLSARIYGAGTDAVIYSDFMEDNQCEERQMNLHDGET